jgi:hypothetical protein
LILDSYRSTRGCSNDRQMMDSGAGALEQKSLLHGCLTAFLGRERRFFCPLFDGQ